MTIVNGALKSVFAASLAAAATWLAAVPNLPADTTALAPAASSSSGAAGTARTGTGTTRFVEVRSGQETWQGTQLAQAANLLLLLARDGQLRRIELASDAQIRELPKPPDPATQSELAAALGKEFGPKFRVIRTAHYLVCHNTDQSFARQTTELVEELYRSFTAYFTARGMGLAKPPYPMVVLIFDDESEFRRYMTSAPGVPALSRISGYYSVETNRVAFFNAAGPEAAKYGDTRWHNLTTVVHEATHQIAFNSGCHRRFADNPLWLVEGLAMFFEAPDVRGKKLVWDAVGRLNKPRLDRFAAFRRNNRPADSLKSLVSSDDRFRNDSSASDAYAESWALTYYLINTRPAQFHRYVKTLAARPSLVEYPSEQRLEDFQAAFGRDLRLLDAAFLRHIDEELLTKK